MLSTMDRDTSLLARSPGLQQRPLETPVLSLARRFGVGSPGGGITRARMDVSQLSFTLKLSSVMCGILRAHLGAICALAGTWRKAAEFGQSAVTYTRYPFLYGT